MVFLLTPIARFFDNVYVFTYDGLLELGNQVMPKRKVGHMVPEGHPGFGGKWPEYIPPKEGDSRCACPALNALANHGKRHITPNGSRLIRFKAYFRGMAATSLSKRRPNNAGKFTTFLQPFPITSPIKWPPCWAKITARIPSIWRRSVCTMALNTMDL